MATAPLYVPGRPIDLSRPFLLSPKDYHVIDGDTLRVLGPRNAEGKRPELLSLRFRSIAAPEKRKSKPLYEDMVSRILAKHGAEPDAWHSGDIARQVMKNLTEGRGLHIKPCGKDKHGRTLCDISRSSTQDGTFEFEGAQSLERLMIKKNASTQFTRTDRATRQETAEDLPPEFPFQTSFNPDRQPPRTRPRPYTSDEFQP